MARWIAKAAVQKGITLLPSRWHHPVNGLFQRHVTRRLRLDDHTMRTRTATAAQHAALGDPGRPVLELGTGWYPIVPLALHLCGYEAVISIDKVPHCTPERLRETAERFAAMHRSSALLELLPGLHAARAEALAERLDRGPAHPLSFGALGITLMVGDARRLALRDGSISMVMSNNVLEHIYPVVLAGILREFRRVLAGGGVMSHLVDLSDHFSHLDPSISRLNFLRFSDRQWNWIDNSIQPQSRLRVDDYRTLLTAAGFEITQERCETSAADDLKRVPLAPRFESKPDGVNRVTLFEFTAR